MARSPATFFNIVIAKLRMIQKSRFWAHLKAMWIAYDIIKKLENQITIKPKIEHEHILIFKSDTSQVSRKPATQIVIPASVNHWRRHFKKN